MVSTYTERKFLEGYVKRVVPYIARTQYTAVLKALGKGKKLRVLDAGCGPGYLTERIAGQGHAVIGLDSSKEWMEFCRVKWPGKNPKYMQGNITSLTMFEDSTFDAVTMNMVLLAISRLNSVDLAMKEAYRVLKPGGRLISTDLYLASVMAHNVERTVRLGKGFSFDKAGGEYKTTLVLRGGRFTFYNVHWPLQTCTELLQRLGFSTTIREVINRQFGVPEYLLYVATKPE